MPLSAPGASPRFGVGSPQRHLFVVIGVAEDPDSPDALASPQSGAAREIRTRGQTFMSTQVFALRRIGSTHALRFGVVGLTGVVINQLVFAFLTVTGLHYALAAIAATQFSSTWNFVGTETWVFAGRQLRGRVGKRYLAFMAVSNSTLLLRVPALWLLSGVIGLNPLTANLVTLVMMFAVRFLVADGWIWAATSGVDKGVLGLQASLAPQIDRGDEEVGLRSLAAVGPGAIPAAYRYDVGGVLRLDSDVELPELAYFMTTTSRKPDLLIRIMRVGALPSRRTRFVRVGERLTYLEQLGMAGANFRITMGDPILVEVAPLLARSRHVLYTNVIEALLRFLMVSRGHVLLHSACVVVDGRAVIMSAQTDTGKTSTVIQLVRDRGYQFLSDDMTIIGPGGRAITYPKPMTLSYHTMSVINGGQMPRRQRAALSIQSRVHSKSGRTVGKALGRLNIPIMSVNSIVQILVPPPKYRIDALMAAEIAVEAPISHAFLMERGEAVNEAVSIDDAIKQLIENTDDAYGFPPFATFAPHIRIGSDDYEALRAKELLLLRKALEGVSVLRVRVPGHEWSELLPGLIEGLDDSASESESESEPEPKPEPIVTAIPIHTELDAAPSFDVSIANKP